MLNTSRRLGARTCRSSRGAHPRRAARAVPCAAHPRDPTPSDRPHREERERRDEHPAVPDRHQLRHPCLCLLLEQPDRISTPRRRPRHLVTFGLTTRGPLGGCEVPNPADLSRPPRSLRRCYIGCHLPTSPASARASLRAARAEPLVLTRSG